MYSLAKHSACLPVVSCVPALATTHADSRSCGVRASTGLNMILSCDSWRVT